MKELFKILEFKSKVDQKTIGKYAHPIKIGKNRYDLIGEYVWSGSLIPLLMTIDTSIEDLKPLYEGLDFNCVKLVTKQLINIE